MKQRILALIVFVFGVAFVTGGLSPAAAEDFYKGKTLNFIVGNAPGGGYDTYTRLTARHIGKHIPGNPTAIVQNRPGGGGLITANYLYNRAKPDGLTLATWNNGLIIQQLLGSRSVKFDSSKFSWVGAPSAGLPMCVVMGFTGLKNLDDVLKSKEPIKMGATDAGTTTADMPKILNQALGTNFDVITGYTGTATIRVAMQRQEVAGLCAGWESLSVTAKPMIAAKGDERLVPILIHGKSDDPEVRDLPQVTKVIKDKDKLALFNAWVLPYEFQRPLSLPPGVPQDRIEILRRAYNAVFEDPQFLAEANKSKLILGLVKGERIQEYVREIMSTPAKAKEGLKFLASGGS